MSLIRNLTNKSKLIITLMVALLITGIFKYLTIPKESYPDVNVPIIITTVTYRGISPEDAERLLAKPIELEFNALENTKEMRTTCFEGGCNIILEYDAGFDSDIALNDVKDKVDLARPELPQGVDEPIVKEINLSELPIVLVNLAGKAPERTLLKIARELEKEIEQIPSVLDVIISGERDEQVEIVISPTKIETYKLSGLELSQFFSRSNSLIAAGNLDTGKGSFSIKVPGLLETVDDVMNLPVKVHKDSVIKLKDIAEIRRNFEDPKEFARVQGKNALILEVKKKTGTNVINTVETIKYVINQAKKELPETISLTYSQNHSEFVKDTLLDLQNSVILAVILVMIVVVIALGVRTGLLVGFAIPASFVMGILGISLLGSTVNMVILFALILSVGMLVDGAIVVTEFADRRMVEGYDKKEAYIEASKKMAWPVISSTATTLVAFAPLAFWPGMVGEFLKFFPITLIATLSASLIVALIFIPILGALFGKPGAIDEEDLALIRASETGHYDKLTGITKKYYHALKWALKRPGKIIWGSVGILVLVFMLNIFFGRGVEFFPESEPDFIMVQVMARGNLSIYEKDDLIKQVEKQILQYDFFKPTTYSRSGAKPSQDAPEEVIGYIQMELIDWKERISAEKIIDQLRKDIKDIPGVKIEVVKPREGPVSGKPINMRITANKNNKLISGVKHIRNIMKQIPGFIDIEDTRPLPGIEFEVEIDRAQAAKFGVDIMSVGQIIKMVTRGLIFSSYRPDDTDEELDIIARYPIEYRNIKQLENLRIISQGKSIPISNFSKVVPKPKVGTIERINNERVMEIKSNVMDGYLTADLITKLKKQLKQNPLPEGINVSFAGDQEDQRESSSFLAMAFLVAVSAMFLILLFEFNNFYYTWTVLFAVILSTVGVLMGTLILYKPFGIVMMGLGVVALAGIVVNNNIVLIDTFIHLKHKSHKPYDAILITALQRLRPILLTAGTTVLGLLPMMFKINLDFVNRNITIGSPSMAWWADLAQAIVFGLAFATILTLFITPCMLYNNVVLHKRLKEENKSYINYLFTESIPNKFKSIYKFIKRIILLPKTLTLKTKYIIKRIFHKNA
jgi:multidrug efflux pump